MRKLMILVLLLTCLVSNALADDLPIRYLAVGDIAKETMDHIKSTMDEHGPELLLKYGIEHMPNVTVKIWQDRDEFEASYGENASHVQGYVVQDNWEIRFFNGRPNLGFSVLHEYLHLISLKINPTFNNNPRWLWESIAIYESGRPPIPEINSLNCFSAQSQPTISTLEEHPFNIYKVGSYITEFIVDQWGQEGLIELIKSNGNMESTLGLKDDEFMDTWIEYLKSNHALKIHNLESADC